jgi:hypothetical protein
MKYADVKIGEYTIPLIGIPASASQEKCDQCRKPMPLREAIITQDGKRVVCAGCLSAIRQKLFRGNKTQAGR